MLPTEPQQITEASAGRYEYGSFGHVENMNKIGICSSEGKKRDLKENYDSMKTLKSIKEQMEEKERHA